MFGDGQRVERQVCRPRSAQDGWQPQKLGQRTDFSPGASGGGSVACPPPDVPFSLPELEFLLPEGPARGSPRTLSTRWLLLLVPD